MSDSPWPNAGRKTRIEPTRVLPSPVFAVTYPRIRNPDLIQPPSRNAMEQSWKQGTFPARDIEVFDIQGAYLIDECLVLDRHLQVIENVSDVYSEAEIARSVEAIKQKELTHRLPHYDRPGIVSKRRAANNYGHFLMEMLPMAVLGQLNAGTTDLWYVTHQSLAPTLDAVFRAFRLMGVPLGRVLAPGWLEPSYFERLIVVRGLTAHGRFMSPLSLLGTERLRQIVADAAGDSPTRATSRSSSAVSPVGGVAATCTTKPRLRNACAGTASSMSSRGRWRWRSRSERLPARGRSSVWSARR